MDFTRGMHLDFDVPDHGRFPCLGLAYEALAAGGSRPAVLNAANEEAVAAFLDDRIAFTSIPETIAEVMAVHPQAPVRDLRDVIEADAWARTRAAEALRLRAARVSS
jgi:1-deoxy-D-xylulose-5-phosphate reductoisomerase